MTSDEVLTLSRLPESVAVIGGGAIGCEFASMLSDLGTTVTVFEALPTILSGCDEDVVKTVARSFRRRGIEVKAGTAVGRPHPRRSVGERHRTHRPYGDGEEAGRRRKVVVSWWAGGPHTEGLGAEGTGVVVDDHGFVVADETMRTAAAGVWAVGDVVAGTPQLAHVAFAEAIVVIKGILGETMIPVDYERVPWAIYRHPRGGAPAGLTEAAAKAAGVDVVVKKDPVRRGTAGPGSSGTPRNMVKVGGPKCARTAPPGRSSGSAWPALGHRAVGAGYLGRQLGGHPGCRRGGYDPSSRTRRCRRPSARPCWH